METWLQNYDPLHNPLLSTLAAALPIVVLLGSIAVFRMRIHLAATLGLVVAFVLALLLKEVPLRGRDHGASDTGRELSAAAAPGTAQLDAGEPDAGELDAGERT